MATIQDVAKHAHVGVGTVSRVLNGKGYVKETTRQKIEASIEALNYTPNEMARSLFFRKCGIVAVIVPEVAHPFFAQFVSEAEKFLCEKGFQTMICNTYYKENYEQRYLEMLKRQKVDGIIFGSHTVLNPSQYENARRPIVTLDRNLGKSIPCVAADHESGGRMAAEELIRSGCRNVHQFAGFKGDEKASMPFDLRHEVFAEIMEEHGIACHSHYTKWAPMEAEYYQKTAENLLREYPDMDGVFATDMLLMAILQAALLRGKRVPEDLKLVSYDGTCGTALIYPRITRIVQPIAELAEEAVRLVVDLINGQPVEFKNAQFQVRLQPGDTTLEQKEYSRTI